MAKEDCRLISKQQLRLWLESLRTRVACASLRGRAVEPRADLIEEEDNVCSAEHLSGRHAVSLPSAHAPPDAVADRGVAGTAQAHQVKDNLLKIKVIPLTSRFGSSGVRKLKLISCRSVRRRKCAFARSPCECCQKGYQRGTTGKARKRSAKHVCVAFQSPALILIAELRRNPCHQ